MQVDDTHSHTQKKMERKRRYGITQNMVLVVVVVVVWHVDGAATAQQ